MTESNQSADADGTATSGERICPMMCPECGKGFGGYEECPYCSVELVET